MKRKFLTSFFLLTFLLSGFVGFSQTTATTAITDSNFEQALIDLTLDSGTPDGSVPTVNIASITSLNVSGKSISSLAGIEAFTSLTTLNCVRNLFTTLDVSANTALTSLNCSNNYDSGLTTLDVSANIALTQLNCTNNQLTSLNAQNGNNTNFIRSSNRANSFIVTGNPNLTCIQVDDASYSRMNWTKKDAIATYSNDCSIAPYSNHHSCRYYHGHLSHAGR